MLIERDNKKRTTRFVFHRRTNVAEAQNTYHVDPAGTFQSLEPRGKFPGEEFSLVNNVAREFAEELLSAEGLRPPRPSKMTEEARQRVRRKSNEVLGELKREKPNVRVRFLGVALDPLTLKPELMFVIVLHVTAKERLLGQKRRYIDNWEGQHFLVPAECAGDNPHSKFEAWMRIPGTLPAGAGCLALAQKHWGLLQKDLDELKPPQ